MSVLLSSSFLIQHPTYSELHGLGTGSTQLSGNDNLATLGTRLHDETEDTVACSSDGKTVEELVSEGLALSDGGETTVLNLGGVEGDRVLWELESLLDEGGELTDAATLLSENLLCVGGADDDIGDGWGDANLDTRVTLLGQLALEELVQLGVENTVCYDLSVCLLLKFPPIRRCIHRDSIGVDMGERTSDELSPLGAVNIVSRRVSNLIMLVAAEQPGKTYIAAP